jgi:transcriptional regulator with XRE-family HTH domain
MKSGGYIIRQLRMEKGFSIRALAEKADVNYVFLSRLERGLETPSEDLIRRIAIALGYTEDINELIALFGKVPLEIQKLILENPDSMIELPAYFKSRKKRGY